MEIKTFNPILSFSLLSSFRFSGPTQTSVVAGNMADSDGGGAATAAPKGGKKRISQIYQKKSQLEHILLRPDTYIGSVQVWGAITHSSLIFPPFIWIVYDTCIRTSQNFWGQKANS